MNTKIKLTCGRVGNGFAQSPKDVIEVPADEAERMIAKQLAERVPETAARRPRRNMMKPKPELKG